MIDVAKHRVFLKRSKLPSTVVPSDFSVGSQVLIYGREVRRREVVERDQDSPFCA